MRQTIKRIGAALLGGVMLLTSLPLTVFADTAAAAQDAYALENTAVRAEISEKTGGFYVRTTGGDAIKKADDNKHLLFPQDTDDTSFASVRITRGGKTADYVFGGVYENATALSVQKNAEEGTLRATWGVDGVTVTQTISLENTGSAEHGMANIRYTAVNSGEAAEVQLRLLLDTALGFQDFGYYQVTGADGASARIETETTLTSYDKSFFAYNDPVRPTIMTYTLNGALDDNTESKPEKVIFAHWNNLAATVFDYTPDGEINFTTPYNKDYLTADSAYALYYDLGSIGTGESAVAATHYGVYSNEKAVGDAVAVNLQADPGLTFADETRTAYTDDGRFTVTAYVENISEQAIDNLWVVVSPAEGIKPYGTDGKLMEDVGFGQPYKLEAVDLKAGENRKFSFDFQVTPAEAAEYRRITFDVYRVDDSSYESELLVADNFLGTATTYLICPGQYGDLPEVTFTGMNPQVVYIEGRRSLSFAGQNFELFKTELANGDCTFKMRRTDGRGIGGESAIHLTDNLAVDAEGNTAVVTLEEDLILKPGQYEFFVDYQDGSTKEDITAPALRFSVVDDVRYRTDLYGIVTVENDGNNQYSVHTYATEAAYAEECEKEGKAFGDEILLEFRGIFYKDENTGSYIGVSNSKDDNVMTMNNCLDFRDGTVTITDEDGEITVDFDAQVLLTGVGTYVWYGVACLTAIEDGGEYSLTTYDEAGNLENEGNITLLWPSVGQAVQHLLGLFFEFKYGELGYMEDRGGVIGFGAALDLSFLVPKPKQDDDTPPTALEAAHADMENNGTTSADALRALDEQIPHDTNTQSVPNRPETATDTSAGGDGAEAGDGDTRSATVQVEDILFGNGYIGCNFAVALGLPSYVDGMPGIEGMLRVKTVGDWAIGMSGAASFANFAMDAEIEIMSRNNIPIPNKLRFFVGGFTPGINLDGVGILWLQGGGGGIDNLYDTIFLTDKIPPLQLIIQAQLSIMQVISAMSEFRLSLRGISGELSNGTVANSIVVMPRAVLQLDWYPTFFFLAGVEMNIADVIAGAGYIAAEQDFMEIFVRAAVSIPGDIPIIGGTELGSVGLGANFEKIWGAASVLGIDFGITYFWGGDFSFDGDDVQPCYAGEFGIAMPVYTDPETDEVLYMALGPNVRRVAPRTMSLTDVDPTPTEDGIATDTAAKTHTVSLMQSTSSALVTIEWDTTDEAAAKEEVKAIAATVAGQKYDIRFLNETEKANEGDNVHANASLQYNANTGEGAMGGRATVTIAFPGESANGKTYTITTPHASRMALYRVDPLPKLTEVTVSGNTVTVTGDLAKFSTVRVLAETSNENAYPIGTVKNTDAAWHETSLTLTLPADLPSGTYTVRAIATDANEEQFSEVSAAMVYENDYTPAAPTITANPSPIGDRMVSFTANPTEEIHGYRVNIYDAAGNLVDGVSGKLYDAAGNPVRMDGPYTPIGGASPVTLTAGGAFKVTLDVPVDANNNEITDDETLPLYDEDGLLVTKPVEKTFGLTAGTSYTLGVSTWKMIDGTVVYSEEEKSASFTVPNPTPVTFTWTLNMVTPTTRTDQRVDSEGVTHSFTTDAYKTNSFVANLKASAQVTGAWTLDGGTPVAVALLDTIPLKFTNLTEGAHTFSFTGKTASGDAVAYTYSFVVDTQPPMLQLSAPVAGIWPSNGTVEVRGLSDADEIVVRNLTTGSKSNPTAPNADNSFAFAVPMDATKLTNVIEMTATDDAGNATTRTVTLMNPKLGLIESVALFVEEGGASVDKTNALLAPQTTATAVRFVGKLSDGTTLALNDPTLVDWQLIEREGEATWEDGVLALDQAAVGMLTARFLVADSGALEASLAYNGSMIGTAPQEDVVTITRSDLTNGTLTLTADGVTVPYLDSYTVYAGQKIVLNAKADAGYRLQSLTVDGATAVVDLASGTATFTAAKNTNPTVTATFVKADTPTPPPTPTEEATVTVSVSHGTVTLTQNGTTLTPNADGSYTVTRGEELTVTVTPHRGYTVTAVLVNGTATAGHTATVPVTGDLAIDALFVQKDTTRPTFPGWIFVRPQQPEADEPAAPTTPSNPTTPAEPTVTKPVNPFTDVADSDWFYDYVLTANANGLMNGVTTTTFGPMKPITRGMFVTVLYRMDAAMTGAWTDPTHPFTDVKAGDYYAEAVAWANANGIVRGVKETTFAPERAITREQMAVMLNRYAAYLSVDAEADTNATEVFRDAKEISDYAVDAMNWAVEIGLLGGKGQGILDPKGTTTRAEAATVLVRMVEKMIAE